MPEDERSKPKYGSTSSVVEDGKTELKYPKGAYFILASYLFERFTYYGLFGGVVFYMQRVLMFSASTASTIKAITEGLIYLAPIAGAILADTYLGKFRTVFIMSCIYNVGAIVFTLSSISPIMTSIAGTQAAGMGGILILGLSAGLMKAVFSSLGPDQFKVPEQRHQQEQYFYAFYWMINAGAFSGQMMTAQLRSSVQCFGDDCYLMPFMILCGFMALSTTIFYFGNQRYHEAPPDTTLMDSLKCICYAAKKSIKDKEKPVDHWIDRSRDKFDGKLIADVKKTLRVMLLFVTYPFFWALFYQTSTGMIFQAKRLYDQIGSYRVPPEITSSINPLLILILIPLFEFVIYPFLDRKKILQSTTHRMTLGMGLGCISFIVYGIVNTKVEQSLLGTKQAQLNIYNTRDCVAFISSDWLPDSLEILPRDEIKLEPINLSEENVTHPMLLKCGSYVEEINFRLAEKNETTIILLSQKTVVLAPTKYYLKDKDAEAKIRVITDTTRAKDKLDNSILLVYHDLVENISIEGDVSDVVRVSPQNYTVKLGNKTIGLADIRQDGVYDIVLSEGRSLMFNMTKPSTTHVLWLLPQYLIITIGEVLFSVSSMDFAYSEAPMSMKSVMQAANLFTITIGLWVYAILNKLSAASGVFDYRASNETFTYAVGMGINTVVFYLISQYYNRKKNSEEALKEGGEVTTAGKENPAFQEDQM